MTSRSAAASATLLAIGPSVANPAKISPKRGPFETRPRAGLRPKTPQHDAGIRIEPPPSLRCATGISPPARAAAAPPLEPPGVKFVSHGFRQIPLSRLSV